MKIVKPSTEIVFPGIAMEKWKNPYDYGIYLLQRIENIARVSHRSEDKQTGDSWKTFIEFVVMKKGDWSVTEHEYLTVEFLVDRGITYELVSHRHFSYTQESTRFVNYEKGGKELEFIDPFDSEVLPQRNERIIWQEAIRSAASTYKELVSIYRVSPQIARSVLPNSLASKIVMTGNLRAWRHFLRMRTTRESHPQMRQVTIPLLTQFKNTVPLLYDDIVPMDSQANAVKLPC